MDPVVHFEMPFDDADRLVKFYKAAFGWKTKVMGADMGGYVVATTSASGADLEPLPMTTAPKKRPAPKKSTAKPRAKVKKKSRR